MSLGELDQDDADLGPTSRSGLHLSLDGYHGQSLRLSAPQVVRAWPDEMPTVLSMDKLVEPCQLAMGARNEKDPVTGFVLIAQSPMSVHTFPRRGFVTADVFTCPDHLDHERIRQSPIATFKLGDLESDLIPCGTRYPLVDPDDPSLTGAPAPG